MRAATDFENKTPLNNACLRGCSLFPLTTWSAMMAVPCEVCAFSGDGASLAIAGLDGEVKIWESSSGTLKQRFSPSSVGRGVQALAWSRPAKEVIVTAWHGSANCADCRLSEFVVPVK